MDQRNAAQQLLTPVPPPTARSDVYVGTTKVRGTPGTRVAGLGGHHAINNNNGQDNLITRFVISTKYYHDLSVDG